MLPCQNFLLYYATAPLIKDLPPFSPRPKKKAAFVVVVVVVFLVVMHGKSRHNLGSAIVKWRNVMGKSLKGESLGSLLYIRDAPDPFRSPLLLFFPGLRIVVMLS